jgi:hypothetical protein
MPVILIIALASLLGVSWTIVSAYLAVSYGVALFIGAPVAEGILCALLCAARGITAQRDVLWLTTWSILTTGLLLLIGHMEGAICLAMALPLALPLALFGAWVTHRILVDGRSPRTLGPLAIVPFLFVGSPQVGLHSVESHVEVAAPPDVVWRNVIEFPDLPAPSEMIFKAGLAYPQRAHIVGRGIGAVRYCEFSTGPFVEPIRVWDEGRLLRFTVTSNPEPLRELTFYKSVHPPHLNGYFLSRQGQFLLRPLPNGHTLLSGTTWYELRMGPGVYWRLWSDYIVHQIHSRVLEHIRSLAETQMALNPSKR